jgi:signal transduction histidine kinase
LIDSSLGDLLHLLGNALSGRANISVILNITGNFFLPSDVQVAFYRVCQEAFFNVAKHSKADRVEVNLDQVQNDIVMRIHDNGVGFDPTQLVAGHYGLGMMRERADAVGARLTVVSSPGQGAELLMCWTKTQPKEVI